MQAKRKLTALLLSLCMVLGMLPMTVFAAGGTTADDLTYGDFTYEINGESVTITGYTGSEGNVTIPSEIEGKPVTAIGERAFSQNKTLTSVAIPDSVTGIGDYAFYMTWSLTSIEIPDGVTVIGDYAFCRSGLKNINIPAGVTTIGMYAFALCESLSSATFAEGSQLSSIGEGAFYQCMGLTDITIPAGVTTIGESAFWECDKLESITFEGRTAPELGDDGVFDGRTALTAIHVPCGADGYTAANGWPEDKVQKSEHLMAPQLRVPATCTTDGTIEHWRCALCGGYFLDEAGTKEISEEQIVEKATGHDWGEPVWNWSDDGKTAAVTFTCKRDEKHTAEPDVTVTQEVKTPATCTEKGVAVDTAKAVLDGKEYTSINESSAVEIAALGHKAEKVDGKAPTATEPGNIEYWYCPQCDTYFKDAGLTEVITKEQTVLAPTGETKPEPSKPDETPAAPTDPPQDKPDKTDDTTESPQTGDSSDMALWIGLMLASCGGVLGMLFYRRKKAAAGK